MMKLNIYLSAVAAVTALATTTPAAAQRKFVHPGISYTQADLDRMRSMVKAQQEPFYSAFQLLKTDYYTTYGDYVPNFQKNDKGERIIWDNPNFFIDKFGRIAWNNALMWKLTDDATYAEKAIKTINAYNGIKVTNPDGTSCLDNSKFFPLIEAAELMRDYSGWKAADQQAFKDFLVYPGYSTKVYYNNEYYWNLTKEQKEKYRNSDSTYTVYWNIYQGDDGRHGNQGLWGLRCLLAMGVYLDNDTIYDRAMNKILSRKHRADDLTFPYGPRKTTASAETKMPGYHLHWGGPWTRGDDPDYGADDELQWWIYDNGQTQEAARDQGHVMDGLCNVTDIAVNAWNQGDDLFTQYDDRLLKGIIFASKYNYGWRNNHYCNEQYWQGEPDFEPTAANGQFYSMKMSRNNAWMSIKINPYSENSYDWSRGKQFYDPTEMLMAYKVRLGRSDDSLLWVKRAVDVFTDSVARNEKNTDYDHRYNYGGELPLKRYRTVWMAGDAGTFSDGIHVSGLHQMPGTMNAVDYDFFNNVVSGENRTWHNGSVTRTDKLYRTEGGMPIAQEGNDYALTQFGDTAWTNYTIALDKTARYEVSVNARLTKGARLAFAVDNSRIVSTEAKGSDDFADVTIGSMKIAAGARVIRLYAIGAAASDAVKSISLSEVGASDEVTDYDWNSRDYKAETGSISTDNGDWNLYATSYASTTQASFTVSASDMNYRVKKEQVYLLVEGTDLSNMVMKEADYRLTEAGKETKKTSVAGQAFQLASDNNGVQTLVWKLDSSTSKRVTPLLTECYTSTENSYILTGLKFLITGKSLYQQTNIKNIDFVTENELKASHPEFFTSNGINAFRMEGADDCSRLYDLQGRQLQQPQHGVYIRGHKKMIGK